MNAQIQTTMRLGLLQVHKGGIDEEQMSSWFFDVRMVRRYKYGK